MFNTINVNQICLTKHSHLPLSNNDQSKTDGIWWQKNKVYNYDESFRQLPLSNNNQNKTDDIRWLENEVYNYDESFFNMRQAESNAYAAETLRQEVGYAEVGYGGFLSIMFSVLDVNSILDSFLLLMYK